MIQLLGFSLSCLLHRAAVWKGTCLKHFKIGYTFSLSRSFSLFKSAAGSNFWLVLQWVWWDGSQFHFRFLSSPFTFTLLIWLFGVSYSTFALHCSACTLLRCAWLSSCGCRYCMHISMGPQCLFSAFASPTFMLGPKSSAAFSIYASWNILTHANYSYLGFLTPCGITTCHFTWMHLLLFLVCMYVLSSLWCVGKEGGGGRRGSGLVS